MIPDPLQEEDIQTLLILARKTIEQIVNHRPLPRIIPADFSAHLQAPGASFVTLTEGGELRGCIGTLEAYQPLVQDVCEHAALAATEDPRFQPVRAQEVALLQIEISRLTTPLPLSYDTPEQLLERLCPGLDGVILRDGFRRATFLPQVWEKIPDKAEFLDNLCQKMGVSFDTWRRKPLQVLIYHVEEFAEKRS